MSAPIEVEEMNKDVAEIEGAFKLAHTFLNNLEGSFGQLRSSITEERYQIFLWTWNNLANLLEEISDKTEDIVPETISGVKKRESESDEGDEVEAVVVKPVRKPRAPRAPKAPKEPKPPKEPKVKATRKRKVVVQAVPESIPVVEFTEVPIAEAAKQLLE